MMGRLLLLLTLLLAAASGLQAQAENTVFKSKDANGNTVFSDQASDTAEEIEVAPPQTFKAQPTDGLFKSAPTPAEAKPGPAYTVLRIVNPTHDTAVRSNAGNLMVQFEVDPPIQANHSLQLMIDGSVVAKQKSTGSISVPNVDRGTHQIQAQIVEDESGKVLQSSNTVSTTVLRVSLLHRATK
tara:strand:+ start:994 stop:1545 length:552 start_codon:yes stop_codon:yes gene_type:complete